MINRQSQPSLGLRVLGPQVMLLLKPGHLRDDLDVFLAMEDIVDDFVEDDFLQNGLQWSRGDPWASSPAGTSLRVRGATQVSHPDMHVHTEHRPHHIVTHTLTCTHGCAHVWCTPT